MINGAKYIFSLGAHNAHSWNVLGLCDIMSVLSWAHVDLVLVLADVYQMVMGVCQEYIRCMCWAYVCVMQIITV